MPTSELIRQLKLVTEPHCYVAQLAIEVLQKQDDILLKQAVEITKLRATLRDLRATQKAGSDA